MLPLLLVQLRMVLLDVSSVVACCWPETAAATVKATTMMEAIECADVMLLGSCCREVLIMGMMQWLRVEVVR